MTGKDVEMLDTIIARLNGRDVTMGETLYSMKLANGLDSVREALGIAIVLDAAKAEGINPSDADLQKAADSFRKEMGLSRASDTFEWMEERGLTTEDLEELARRKYASDQLRAIVTKGKIDEYFAKNRPAFDRACVYQIIVPGEDTARDLLKTIGDKEQFMATAERQSLDETTRSAGGFVGWRMRNELSLDVAKAIFSAVDGDVVGPITEGNAALLIFVEKIERAQLDARTRSAVEDAVYMEWLMKRRQEAQVEFLLPTQI